MRENFVKEFHTSASTDVMALLVDLSLLLPPRRLGNGDIRDGRDPQEFEDKVSNVSNVGCGLSPL